MSVRRFSLTVVTSLLAAAAPDPARAGGVIRPNINGARAVGMGGAYVAVADDALSIFHNPAGLARIKKADLYLSFELPFILRKTQPPDYQTGGLHAAEKPVVAPLPVPFIAGGARIRFGLNHWLAIGAGFYNNGGGSVRYDKKKVTEGVVRTFSVLFEFTPTIAYAISRRIMIGASLRVGLGFFEAARACVSLTSCAHNDFGNPLVPQAHWGATDPRNAAGDVNSTTRVDTMTGLGAGYSFGIQILPTDWMGIGIVYRSNLFVRPSKSEAVSSGSAPFDAKIKLPFPQSVQVGVFFQLHEKAILAAQFGWVDNSQFQELFIDVEGWTGSPEQIRTPLDMKDSFSAHLGTEIKLHRLFTLRAGVAYDSKSIPTRMQQRHLVDSDKMTFDLGGTFQVSKRVRIEFAMELLYGDVSNGFKTRDFTDVYDCPNPANELCSYQSPSKRYPGGVFSLHLGVGYTF